MNYFKKIKSIFLGLTLSGLFILPSVASSAVFEEIVVTAQKREQNLQDVGISISAFTGDQLKSLGINSTKDLQNTTPGLVYSEFGGAASVSTFSLRGVAQLDFSDHNESPNAVYLDGAYISFIGGLGLSFFDVERAEVLRGPQGTLFGRNATGGLINLVSRQPTQEFEAYLDVTVGEYSQFDTEGAVSGGLTDNLSARLSFNTNSNDGFIKNDNPAGSESPEADNYGIRLQFLYDPSDDLSLHLGLRGSENNKESVAGYDVSERVYPLANGLVIGERDSRFSLADYATYCSDFFFTAPDVAAGENCSGHAETDDDPFRVNSEKGVFDREYYGATFTIEKEFDEISFTSITDYQMIDKFYSEDDDGSSVHYGRFTTDHKGEQYSQELRLTGGSDRMRWQSGLYFLYIDGEFSSRFDFSDTGAITEGIYDQETLSYAIFGQGEYDLTDELTAVLGLRYTYDEKDVNFHGSCIETFNDGGCLPFSQGGYLFSATDVHLAGFKGTAEDEDVSFKAQLDYKANDNALIYFGISRGVKSTTHSGSSFAALPQEQFFVEPEKLTSYEIGVKYSLGESTRINASAFYYDYRDFQAFQFVGNATVLFNLDADIAGTDLELVSSFENGWDFLLGVSYLDTKAKDVVLPDGVTLLDREMALAPDLSVNAMIRKAWNILDGEFAIQIDGNYVDSRFLSPINHPSNFLESYTVFNARMGYSSSDERWSVTAFVNNLADKEYRNYTLEASETAGNNLTTWGAPRWVGVTLTYNWN